MEGVVKKKKKKKMRTHRTWDRGSPKWYKCARTYYIEDLSWQH